MSLRVRTARLASRHRDALLIGTVVGAVAVAAIVVTALTTLGMLTGDDATAASTKPDGYGLWDTDTLPPSAAYSDTRDLTLGTIFSVREAGRITAVQFYRVEANEGPHQVSLATVNGRELASADVPHSRYAGWITAPLDEPVRVEEGAYYVASYRAPHGHYSLAPRTLSWDSPIRRRSITAWQSQYRYVGEDTQPGWRKSNYFVGPVFLPDTDVEVEKTDGKARAGSGEPGPPDVAGRSWPGPDTTGVPDGVALQPYTGPSTITEPGAVLDGQTIVGPLVIAAPDVVISRSQVRGTISADSDEASVRIVDSEVDGGPGPAPAVGYHHVTVLRSEITGGQHSVLCGDDCRIEDSWLHSQSLPPGEAYHNNAFLSNGGSGVVLRNNRLACTPPDNGVKGGCSGDVSLFGDFAPISDVEITGNLFEATPGGFCGSFGWNEGKRFGLAASDVVVTDNVFERGPSGHCGSFAAVTSYSDAGAGLWRGNVWVDGGTLAPSR